MWVGLIVLAALLIPATAAAQKPKRKCTGTPPDSTVHVAVPIYRDCEVDKPAKVRGPEPRPDISAVVAKGERHGCFRAEFEFVVDSLGFPELTTVQPHSGNDQDLETAVSVTLGELRYEPARLEGRPVRQVVVYKVVLQAMTRVSSPGRSTEPSAADFRPPRC